MHNHAFYMSEQQKSCTVHLAALLTRWSATADRKCASNMALSHGGVQKAFQSETV